MAYIFKQKLQIQDLVNIKNSPKRILIYEPEEYLAALYGHYLKMHNFDIKHCPNLEALKPLAEISMPDILIFSAEGGSAFTEKIAWLLNFKKNFPNVLIVTTGFKVETEALKQFMSAGVSSHLNRQLTRPQDLAVIVKNILYN